MFISGMKMGNIIAEYLDQHDIYTLRNYNNAFRKCRKQVTKIKSGEGKGIRYRYDESEIIPVLNNWKKTRINL